MKKIIIVRKKAKTAIIKKCNRCQKVFEKERSFCDCGNRLKEAQVLACSLCGTAKKNKSDK